ncbi:hypothetical protein ACIA5A_24060 [Micromonospora sp. NPDC051300]|uniref:hypothetical protein n=1 Tax=Micromonospora sp. NPDC051300 TaxID=3364286 RepID=UPI0037B2D538
MGEVRPMPAVGDLFADLRGEDRTLRVSHHPDRGAVVLSLWRGPACRGSFRLAEGDVDRLLALLTAVRDGTARGPGETVGAVDAPTDPAVARTGEISGTAHRVAWPAPRVA